MRLNRYLAFCGLGSRRACDELISSGAVEVNGLVCLDFSTQIDELRDTVRYNGKLLSAPSKYSYIMLHKPVSYVCTRKDPQNRRTIYSLLNYSFKSMFYVGRLDYDSSGLLLLTNDGGLSHSLLHPSYGVSKEYFVVVSGFLSDADVDVLLKGIELEEGFARASSIRILKRDTFRSSLYLTMKQGMRRQIRRMFASVGMKVVFLRRDAFGPLRLFPLREASYRELTQEEIGLLLKCCKRTS